MQLLEQLAAIEGVRKTKATYWYAMDTKNWPMLSTVFNQGSIVDFRGEREMQPGEIKSILPSIEEALSAKDPAVVKGGAEIVRYITNVLTPWISVHHGSEPIIDVIDAAHAKAIFPVFDYIDTRHEAKFKGWGHYHESYLKVGDRWTIDRLFLTRIRVDGENMDKFNDPFR